MRKITSIILAGIILSSVLSIGGILGVRGGTTNVTLYSTPENCDDAWIEIGNDNNHGSSSEYDVSDVDGQKSFIRFNDLSSIPSDAVISSAILKIFAWGLPSNMNLNPVITTHTVVEQWTENTINGNDYPNNAPSQLDSYTLHGSSTEPIEEWADFDITIVFQGWVDGSVTNYGVRLYTSSSNVRAYFYSSDYSVPSFRPYIEVTYESTSSTNIPSEPRNLIATPGDSQILLDWDVPSDDGGSPVTGYKIYKGTSPTSLSPLPATVNAPHTDYLDYDVMNGVTYYYTVAAINDVGEGPQSNQASATPPGTGNTAPTASFTVSPTSGDISTTFNVDASGCSDAEDSTSDLQVRWDWNNDGTWDTSYSTTKTATHQYSTEGTKIIVLEVKDTGELTDATTRQVTVSESGDVPGEPRNLAATPGDNYIQLDWDTPLDDGGSPVTSYIIYKGTAPTSLSPLPATVNAPHTDYLDYDVEGGMTYYYMVLAINNNGEGPLSTEASAVPFPYYFVHLTDTHHWLTETPPIFNSRFSDMLQHIHTFDPSPSFVILSGDLVEWGASTTGLANFLSLTSHLYKNNNRFYIDETHTIPIYFCPGNHDYRNIYQITIDLGLMNYCTTISYEKDYMSYFGNVALFSLNTGYDVFEIGDIVVLPDSWGLPEFGLPEGSGLEDNQITWLEQELDLLDGEENGRDDSSYKKVIFMHHPYINAHANEKLDGAFTKKRVEFRGICENYSVDIVLSGHAHDAGDTFGGIWDEDGGRWDSGDGTKYIVTNAAGEYMAYRNISVASTGLDVGTIDRACSVANAEFACSVEVHIYDSQGRHAGPNEAGEIELEIPGAYYSTEIVDNHTHTTVSVYYGTDDYTFKVVGTGNETMNFTVEQILKDGSTTRGIYENIDFYEGSEATIEINQDDIDYNVEITNPDGENITVTPTRWEEDTDNGASGGIPGFEFWTIIMAMMFGVGVMTYSRWRKR